MWGAGGAGVRWFSKVTKILPLGVRSRAVNVPFMPIFESFSLSYCCDVDIDITKREEISDRGERYSLDR